MKITNTTIYEFLIELKKDTGVEIYPDGDSVGIEVQVIEVSLKFNRPTAIQCKFLGENGEEYNTEFDTVSKEDARKLFNYISPYIQDNFDQN